MDLNVENSNAMEGEACVVVDTVPVTQDKPSLVEDPYAYIDKNGFTSERYKIELRNLPRYYGISELRKLLNEKLNLNLNKIKSPGLRSQWVYVCFRNEQDRENAIKVLHKYQWKGRTLEAKLAEPAPDPLVKRRNQNNADENNAKRIKLETPEQQEEAIKNSATPLWNVPYDLQVKEKMVDVTNVLRKLGCDLVRENANLKGWIEKQREVNNGLPCKLLEIKSLPDYCDYYRNKCEFSIGKNELTGERTVGFRLGTYASGSIGVAPVSCLKHFSQRMLKAVYAFEKFVRASPLEIFSADSLTGHWRQLTVRVGVATDQLMLIAGMHPQSLTPEEISEVKTSLKEFFSQGEGREAGVTSLYLQMIQRKEHGKAIPPIEHLLGEPFIEEVVCGLRFKISPLSFFQVNTKCTELLVETVRELVNVTPETTVLDICCGTGMLGLCLAKHCSQVLGLELLQEAVNDARLNAKKNGIENCEFFCGKADEIMGSVVTRAKSDNIIAIVDPPRAGLHQKAIQLLRRTRNLDKMVFLSCDAKSASKNFTELGRNPSKTMLGFPFVPVAAVAVDLFPHTRHYELVIYFERLNVAQRLHEIDPKVVTENLNEGSVEPESDQSIIKSAGNGSEEVELI